MIRFPKKYKNKQTNKHVTVSNYSYFVRALTLLSHNSKLPLNNAKYKYANLILLLNNI